MTNVRARHEGRLVDEQLNAAEIISGASTPSRNGPPNCNDMATQLERGFDLLFFVREMDVLADGLAMLAPSMERTALELRLAQMRQVVELRHKQLTDRAEIE